MTDAETEAERTLRDNGFDLAEPPDPIYVACCVVGASRVVVNPAMRVAARYRPHSDTIEIRSMACDRRARFLVAHEIGERAALLSCYMGDDAERQAQRFAAALCAPALAVRRVVAFAGRDLAILSDALDVSQSVAALRLGEVLHSPLVLVGRLSERLHVRGEPFAWPSDPEIRRLAHAAVLPRELERARLTDARRVVLAAA